MSAARPPLVQYLTPQDVADSLAVQVRTIYNLISAGDLDAVRIGGGRLRVNPDALAEYLQRSSTRKPQE